MSLEVEPQIQISLANGGYVVYLVEGEEVESLVFTSAATLAKWVKRAIERMDREQREAEEELTGVVPDESDDEI